MSARRSKQQWLYSSMSHAMRRLATVLATLSLVAVVLLAKVAYTSRNSAAQIAPAVTAQQVQSQQAPGGGESIADDEVPMASGTEQIEDDEVPMAAPGQSQEANYHSRSLMMAIGAVTLAVAAFFMVHIHKLNSNISAMRGKLD